MFLEMMKWSFFLLLTTFLVFSQVYCENVSYNDLVKIKGIYYKKKSNTAFTGKVNGLLKGEFKEGMKHGEFINIMMMVKY